MNGLPDFTLGKYVLRILNREEKAELKKANELHILNTHEKGLCQCKWFSIFRYPFHKID